MKEGSLKLASKILAGNLNRNLPGYLVFFVTSRCNCRCPMCFNWQNVRKDSNAQKELTLNEIEKIAKSMKSLPQLLLSGGEPFLRKDIAQIVQAFYDNSGTRQISIPTNAMLTRNIVTSTEKMLSNCKDAYFNINFALDGIGKDHDISRGVDGCFEKLTETYSALDKLRERDPRLSINFLTTIKKSNVDKLKDIKEYVEKNFKPNYHNFGFIRGDICPVEEKDFDMAKAEETLNSLYEDGVNVKSLPVFPMIAPSVIRLMNRTVHEMRKQKTRQFHCLAGRKMVVITEEGFLMPCEPLWLEPETRKGDRLEPFIMADLRDFDFNVENALKSQQARKVIEFIAKKECYCEYGCAIINSIVYSPKMHLKLIKEILRK